MIGIIISSDLILSNNAAQSTDHALAYKSPEQLKYTNLSSLLSYAASEDVPLLALSLALLTVFIISTEDILLTVFILMLPFVRFPPPPAEYV